MKTQELMITMSDGIRLQTFVYLPAGDGSFEALMGRCIYGVAQMSEEAGFWTNQGYAVVLQNVRGRHRSEGDSTGLNNFGQDGYDTIEWMLNQSWCRPHIGTIGRSALARVQIDTAFLGHRAHKAMAPMMLPFGMNLHFGGAYMFSQIPQWFYYCQSGPELKAYEQVDWMPHLYTLPITDVLDKIGGPINLYHQVLADPLNLNVWRSFRDDVFKTLTTPNLMVTGWYDHCATGTVDFYLKTIQYASEAQKRHTHMIIGPWDHGADRDAAGEYDFGPQAEADHHATEAAFFDYHLRGKPPAEPLAPVKIFVMGRNHWRDEDTWPLKRAVPTKFYLHSNGDVSGAWVRGNLSTTPPGEEKPDRFTYDPADPVPTWGGANSGPAIALPMSRGPRDQRLTLYRTDVLTFYSAPFETPLEATGMLKLVLYAASTAEDTDFTAKLMDVGPDGNARLLSDGLVRARFRDDYQNPSKIVPHKIYPYEIDLWFTSNEFQTGHRLALAISSSNFPRIGRNLNTGGDNERDRRFITAQQTIYHDSDNPSHLELPVVPRCKIGLELQ